ncbi:hypothetical protein BHM03_00002945 [Ensete ventricosum]|uniref:ATPase AAA-type core domain-containing protein n=1 Tax=Ensete ventricosum TaxID=4639 RepID=A0A445M9X0_ENSVE|nr:hypothetical protein BHM03_00002945 [Ensete ventricosum]
MLRLPRSAVALSATAAASAALAALSDHAYADGSFRIPYLSSPAPPPAAPAVPTAGTRPPGEAPGAASSSSTSSGGFDPEALERGAKALREINSSPHSKQVFELMRKQEETRLAEVAAEKTQYLAIQAEGEIHKLKSNNSFYIRIVPFSQKKKRIAFWFQCLIALQIEHEAQRRQNVELVRMQEDSSVRKEQARRATEEQIHAQLRQTEKERAEIERETIRVKAMAEAEGRAHEAKLTEEHNRRMLLEHMKGEREKWIAAINTTFSHIEGDELLATNAVLACQVIIWYSSKICLIFYLRSFLCTDSHLKLTGGLRMLLTDRGTLIMAVGGVTALAAGVYTTRFTQTSSFWKVQGLFGLIIFFIFVPRRNSIHMSEAQRSALNALLFRTGDQSRDIVLVLATNRPGDLDAAVTDRMDEVIEFPLPGEEERYKLLKLYLGQYILQEGDKELRWNSLFKKKQQKIIVKDMTEDVLREAARKTAGFSGREIAKLMASVQAAVYGRPNCMLDSELFMEIVNYKVTEHHQRIKLATEAIY